ncbi:LCP family protein [Longispora sp. NPDC051575]|uniref:LCP family protein n=1 Tax=Longispora sp. NPDC051575 TaxID=3154943 RepID=UPI00343D5087
MPRLRTGRRAPLWTRLCIGLGAFLLLLSSGALVTGRVLLDRYEGAVRRADLLPDGTARTVSPGSVAGPLNLLLVGSDLRQGLEHEVWRSDTIMVVHVNERLDRAYVLSIPRDLQVRIPRCLDAVDGCIDKINAAFAYGGIGPPFDPVRGYQLLAETVRDLTGLRFDAAGIIDFTGFTRLVGALGGVRLCVDVETTSIHSGMTWEPGCHDFNEHSVLDYIRQREYPDGDVTRQRHQQQFIKAVLQQALARGILADPARLDRLIRAAGESLTIASPHPTTALFLALRGIRPENITLLQLPAAAEWIDGVAYAEPVERTEPMFAALREDRLDEFVLANPDVVNR